MRAHGECLAGLHAGCSALSWSTDDGKHLFARSLDFTGLTEGSRVTFVPRGTVYDICSGRSSAFRARYAAVGIGLLLEQPVLYEGINERGLMGAQLYYRGFAHFARTARVGTQAIQPPMVVYHLLAQCESVEQVVNLLSHELTPTAVPMMGTVPPLHWMFTDRTGESIVVEPDADGLHIYRNTVGVMTNSPSYPWQRLNLLCYAGIRDLDYGALQLCGDRLEVCFSGSGAQGLPGDWSAPARFVRLCFLREYGCKGSDEGSGVARLFRLMDSAAFPLGMVRVTEGGEADEAYDYTIYTAVMCAESGRFYWTTYENQSIQYVDLTSLCERDSPKQFTLAMTPDFRARTP